MIKKNNPNELIIVDGVVGSGKTTFMNLLKEELSLPGFEEPVTDNPLLEKFYHDRKRYSFPLQVFFLNRRFRMLKDAGENLTASVMDRSIYGDVIFAKLLHEGGDMEKDEFDLYQELLVNMLDHIESPKLMIYLKCDVDTAIHRIEKRGRDYEQIVERDYWERLNKEYEAYFKEYNLSKLLVIDVKNYDLLENEKDRKEVMDLVKKAISES
ncbi:deoxynucleoside kinase [Proteiniclasticum ruminis]|uniref:Deoxyadenosine/deoxycytidine kinase n=2 Tax=Proteiniclasticum ruminis TaxID=398199 RepID=A0A1G8P6P8_9CLOT|nr:deoxynucleoside kinase [Proteiniclasticum ruminis]SDI87968.1 Deoxyadenosine/deoxycytidine kinase [Proteiniclasticum ruminis]